MNGKRVLDGVDLETVTELLDSLPHYACLIDRHHRIHAANRLLVELVGGDPLTGHLCPQRVHGCDRPVDSCPLEAALRSGEDELRTLHDPVYGTWTESSIHATPFQTAEGEPLYLHLAADATERIQLGQTLERTLSEQRHISQLLVSLQGCASQVEVLDAYGRAAGAVLSLTTSVPFLSFEHRDGQLIMLASPFPFRDTATCDARPQEQCACHRVAQGPQPPFPIDAQLPSGCPLAAEGRRPFPIAIENDGALMAVVVLGLPQEFTVPHADVSLLTVMASRTSIVLAERRARAAELAALDRAIRDERQGLLGRLTAGITHDLNNLLMGINSLAQLILVEDEDIRAIHEEARSIQDATASGAGILRQILDFATSRISNDGTHDLNETTQKMVAMLRRVIPANVELLLELDPAPLAIMADPHQVEQVLMNLVLNAKEAMPQAGGTIRLRTSLEPAAAGAHGAPPATVVLQVIDTGHGMDPETQLRAFEPFFSKKRALGGSGLGLYTVRRLLELSGGHVRLQSTPGEGTTVTIRWVEQARARGAPASRTDAPISVVGASERVLVVEDDALLRSVIQRILMKAGYRAVVASEPAEAVHLWERSIEPPEALITDVVLPGDSGVSLARRLRRHSPNLPVILMTGYEHSIDGKALSLLEGCIVLKKPFTPDALLEALLSALTAAP